MKIRFFSGAAAAALLIVVVLSHQIVLTVALAVIALIGIHEYYSAISTAGDKPLKIAGYISCGLIIPLGFSGFEGLWSEWVLFTRFYDFILLSIFLLIGTVISFSVFAPHRYNPRDVSLTLSGIIYVPFLFSFILLIRNMPEGSRLVWMIFLGGWITDIFAFFAGVMFGKHKLIPAISPKKTIEGAAGGIIACVAVFALFGYLMRKWDYLTDIPFGAYIPLGFIVSLVSQLGDLTASSVKRYAGIKDFGRIMPGHGGVLDRLDSLLLVSPVVYFYLHLICGIG